MNQIAVSNKIVYNSYILFFTKKKFVKLLKTLQKLCITGLTNMQLGTGVTVKFVHFDELKGKNLE